jgi:hypothetical protein
MGDFVKDGTVADIQHQRNKRFRSGQPLQEMVQIHREFGLFSGKYSLRQATLILNIVPTDPDERSRVFIFLDKLKEYASDIDGMSGHDRILKAYRDNLESETPFPVHHAYHRYTDDRRVTVTRSRPIVYEDQEYLVISLPTRPATRPSSSEEKK